MPGSVAVHSDAEHVIYLDITYFDELDVDHHAVLFAELEDATGSPGVLMT